MKITRKQLSLLIEMALGRVRYAQEKDDDYEFTEQMPDTFKGTAVESALGDVEVVKNFFKDSVVDVDILVLPDVVFAKLTNHRAPFGGINPGSILNISAYKLKAYLAGKSKKLQSILKSLDPTKYTIICQKRDKGDLGLFLFDLPWITHDLFGHALEASELRPFLEHLRTIAATFTLPATAATGGHYRQTIVDPLHSESDPNRRMREGKLGKELKEFFTKEGFTARVRPIDTPASVIGYYAVKSRFPDPIYKHFSKELLETYEDAIKRNLNEFYNGKAGFMSFE